MAAVDVPQPDRATLGGAIAANAAGPRRYGYGTIRDYLLGFTAVDGRGQAFSGGGRVVKNAAGYNMCRLMAGSLGTLGVVTQVTLMVRPLPRRRPCWPATFPIFDLAEQAPGRPDWLGPCGRRRSSSPVAGTVLRPSGGTIRCGPDAARQRRPAVRRVRGTAAEVDWMIDRSSRQWTALGTTSPDGRSADRLASDRLWRWLAGVPANVQISVLPGKSRSPPFPVAQAIIPTPASSRHAGRRRRSA